MGKLLSTSFVNGRLAHLKLLKLNIEKQQTALESFLLTLKDSLSQIDHSTLNIELSSNLNLKASLSLRSCFLEGPLSLLIRTFDKTVRCYLTTKQPTPKFTFWSAPENDNSIGGQGT